MLSMHLISEFRDENGWGEFLTLPTQGSRRRHRTTDPQDEKAVVQFQQRKRKQVSVEPGVLIHPR